MHYRGALIIMVAHIIMGTHTIIVLDIITVIISVITIGFIREIRAGVPDSTGLSVDFPDVARQRDGYGRGRAGAQIIRRPTSCSPPVIDENNRRRCPLARPIRSLTAIIIDDSQTEQNGHFPVVTPAKAGVHF
jgi:hypothetical protein